MFKPLCIIHCVLYIEMSSFISIKKPHPSQLYPPPVPPIRKLTQASEIASSTKGQRAEARRTTILQPVEQKPHSQKDR